MAIQDPTQSANPDFSYFNSIKDWHTAVESAKVRYTFLGGRKFILQYQGCTLKLSLNGILRRTLSMSEKSASQLKEYSSVSIVGKKDYKIIETAIESEKIIKKFKECIQKLDSDAEKERLRDLKSRKIKIMEKIVHWMLKVHRYFGMNHDRFYCVFSITEAMSSLREAILKLDVVLIINRLETTKAEKELQITTRKLDLLKEQKPSAYKPESVLIIGPQGEAKGTADVAFQPEEVTQIEQRLKEEAEIPARKQAEIKTLEQEIAELENLIGSFEELKDSLEPGGKQQDVKRDMFSYNFDDIQNMHSNKKLDEIVQRLKDAQKLKDASILFQLTKPYTKEQLTKAINKLYLVVHPDKQDPTCQKCAAWLFNVIRSLSVAELENMNPT